MTPIEPPPTIRRPTRPMVRYHGGKWHLAAWVITHLPPHRVYVEPYGGAASVLMRKERSHGEVWNDLSGEMFNLFQVVRDRALAAELERLLRYTPFSRREFELSYQPHADPLEQARRTVVRHMQCHGSTSSSTRQRTGFRATGWRANQSAPIDWMTYPDALHRLTGRLQGVVLECQPALAVIARNDAPDTLFYCDPPYPHATRTAIRWPSDANKCYAHEMTDQDHRELAEVLHRARGFVLLSSYPGDLYAELYAGWPRVTREWRASGAIPRTEVLWLSPRTAEALLRSGQLTEGDLS